LEDTVVDPFVIHTVELRKTYDGVEALRGLNLQVPAGSIFGFLGKNGAGKTTAMKVLLGMARPTSGDARVFGLRPASPDEGVNIRRRAAFVSEDKSLYDAMNVDAMIRFTASFFPRWRADLEQRYLRTFELPRHAAVKTLSRGMRTKLALLLALCRGAELLVLDEPSSGLDPAITEQVLQALIAHVADEGMTVFFSSHQIADVDQIADHVAIIDRGRVVVSGALDDLRRDYRRLRLVFDSDAPDAPFRAPGIAHVRRAGRVLTLLTTAGTEQVVDEARALAPASMDILPVTLKEIFLETVAVEE
jgi:ABC-2 type transport system ATP-binding protein